MPALIANTVTLEEVLEVRGEPLSEQELWSILAQSCQALHDIFMTGKTGRQHFGTYPITPSTILLCHTGKVKFSLDVDNPNDRSFTAPETYARKALPSETALEKVCVYSIGMSLYHAADFEVAVGKPISLHESLENVLLTMCEDSAQARSNLTEILQECHSRGMSKSYSDVVASLVESVLGDEMPDIVLEGTPLEDISQYNASYHDIIVDELAYSPSISPARTSPRHLPTPPPPQITTRGQATSVELVGSNYRSSSSPPSTLRSRLNNNRNLTPSFEKYENFLDNSQSKRSMTKSLNGLDQLDSRLPAKHCLDEMTEIQHCYGQPPLKHPSDLETKFKGNVSRNEASGGLRRYSSMNSVASSSTASGPRSSMFSDGRSSSVISITQGSYAPESYLTDGYDSEFYINSLGSSGSHNHFRNGSYPHSLRDKEYPSYSDLGHPLPAGTIKSPPLVKQFTPLHKTSREEFLSPNVNDGTADKTFFGPEFVMITEDPEKSIVNITPNIYLKKDAQKKSGSHNRKMVTVVALNGQKLQLMAEVSMTTKELYEHVIKFLGITEKSFFGLAKLEDDEVIFLELDVKLSKYAPTKWKESKGDIGEFILYFRVKFYVEHTALLSRLSSRHQFYLQIRKDILEGRLYCHDEAAFVLAGLALQAETGDYDGSLEQGYFLVEHYLHPRIINKVSAEYAVSQLPEFHQNFAGLSEEQAELDFVRKAQKLPEYGIHFYKVQASKKVDAEKLYLGICVRGITIYESMGHVKSPIHKHSWPLTKKISFKKRKFFIEPRANPDGAKLTFYTDHYKKAKYLLSMCTAFHRFQMKMRTRLASIEHEVALDKQVATEKQQNQSSDSPKKVSPYERMHTTSLYKQNTMGSSKDVLHRSVSQEFKHSSDILQQDQCMGLTLDSNHNDIGNGPTSMDIHITDNNFSDKTVDTPDEMPYVIDSTLNDPQKQGINQEYYDDDVKKNQPLPKELELPKPGHVLASPDREISVIKLRREPLKGLGITVLGGENSKRLDFGIYVKSITEGGAAAKDGRLKAGDRILAVNGNSLEHVTHEKAVSLLKTTSSNIELVVSQSAHNASVLDLSNIPSTSSTNEEPQTLEVKPLITPPQHNTRSKNHLVESTWSSDIQSPTDSPPSTFDFPTEDEPVTMISKSISSSATSPPSYQDSQISTGNVDVGKFNVEKNPPEPVTVAKVESSSSYQSPPRTKSATSLAVTRLSSLDSHQSETSNESYSTGSERSTDHELSDKGFFVELDKVNGSLGLSVTGGINTTVKHGAIYVKSLILNGPADRNGRVRVGDRILKVNGISLESVTHKQAVEIIKKAPQQCKILIDRSIHVNVPTSIKKTSTRNHSQDKPFVVELRKGIGGLGLSLVGGRDSNPEHGGLLRIKKMFPGQPAALSNRLLVGDIVLEVNGNSLENASHQDAINLIRHEPSVVRLLMKREPSSIPAVLLSRASSDASDIDPAQLLSDIQSKLRTDSNSYTEPETLPIYESSNENIMSEELPNEENGTDRTEVWVKQESPRIKNRVGFERSLTHQLSDPLSPRHVVHEPITTSNSLPGKFALKSRFLEEAAADRRVRTSGGLISSDSEKRQSAQIASESDLSSIHNSIKSEDSLHRVMSPRAPLAEYEESDLDEGIMISVDDGTIMDIDDEDHEDDGGGDDMEKTLTDSLISSNKGVSDNIDFVKHNTDSTSSGCLDTDNVLSTTSQPTLDSKQIISVHDCQQEDVSQVVSTSYSPDNGDEDSINDGSASGSDIDSVLELLDAVENDSKLQDVETTKTNTVSMEVNQPQCYDNAAIKEISVATENEPAMENDVNYTSKLHNLPNKNSFSTINDELPDNDDDVLIDENFDATVTPIDADSSLIVEESSASMRLTPKEELLTVELEKRGSGGLGFTLAGGADTMGGCFVRDIIGDPAKDDGRLQKGDQILQVDDVDIRQMKHMAAVNILRATKKNVKLIVLRRPTMVINEGRSLETVNLTRTSRGRIGLLLTEGDGGIILVDDVVPGEPAALEGNLKHGDRIIEIGGRKVDGIGFLSARQYLDASRPVVQLLVERRNRAAFSKYSMGDASLEHSLTEELTSNMSQSDGETTDQESDKEDQTDKTIKIELGKGPRGFGFSLVAAPSSEPNVQGIFIKTISAESVAEKDGRLRVGDQLLTVNEEDVRGLSHARVIGMLRKVTTSVTLEIKRADSDIVKPSSVIPSSKDGRKTLSSETLDLDITLEDKKTLTGSSNTEEDIDNLAKPKLYKRDTDSVLSCLLNSIGSPLQSSNASDLSDADSNYSEVKEDYSSVDSPPSSLDSVSSGSLKRISSCSLEDKRLPYSSVDITKTDDSEDYDDVDVFDMLHDNSEPSKLSLTVGIDLPPPLPDTPIPSDDEDLPPLTSMNQSLSSEMSDDGWSSESDLSSPLKISGFASIYSSSNEGEMSVKQKPLVDVISGGRYTGHKLKMLIGVLKTKLNSNALSEEFKALRTMRPTDNCDIAKHPDNKEKNRYRNVLPFDSTRVRLSGENNDDYINASHIRVPVGQDNFHYVATQGPLPNTINDFWQLIWEQGIEVIAMVTLEKEGEKIKCCKYWPDSHYEPLHLPKFQVSLLEKKTSESFTERTLSLKHLETNESIEVAHLNFIAWPDHGVPKSAVGIVQFVTYTRSLMVSQAPILVHCSAGIGRTGALITLDIVLGLIKRDQMFDVVKIIRTLREQRQGMIQTKDQFIFCYMACLDVLRSLSG